jgi:hypothetical protein
MHDREKPPNFDYFIEYFCNVKRQVFQLTATTGSGEIINSITELCHVTLWIV